MMLKVLVFHQERSEKPISGLTVGFIVFNCNTQPENRNGKNSSERQKHCLLQKKKEKRRKRLHKQIALYLYCIVSDVVEALSLVMRILTMLKRKTKFIQNKEIKKEQLGNVVMSFSKEHREQLSGLNRQLICKLVELKPSWEKRNVKVRLKAVQDTIHGQNNTT